jgi:hypothetical protein
LELENVVDGAQERPFSLGFLDASEQELAEASRLFDLSEDGFDAVKPFPDGVAVGRGR